MDKQLCKSCGEYRDSLIDGLCIFCYSAKTSTRGNEKKVFISNRKLGKEIMSRTGNLNEIKKDNCPYTHRLTDFYKIPEWMKKNLV